MQTTMVFEEGGVGREKGENCIKNANRTKSLEIASFWVRNSKIKCTKYTPCIDQTLVY